MINSVLLPNESNQPLVDNLFTKKIFSDLLSYRILSGILTCKLHRYLAEEWLRV
jgi:hypothetical protein